jgi:hypothetical protein
MIQYGLISNVLLIVSMFALFSMQLSFSIVAACFAGVLAVLVRFSSAIISDNSTYWYVSIVLLLLVSTMTFNHGVTPLFYLIVGFFNLLWARQLAKKSIQYVSLVLCCVYWIIAFVIITGLMFYWDEPEPLGAIFPWASTNGLPSYLIIVQIAYSLSRYLSTGRVPVVAAAVTLVVAVFGLGRGSVIVALILLVFSILINLHSLKFIKKKKYLSFVSLIFAFIAISFFVGYHDVTAEFISAWINKSRFSAGFLDEHRGQMLTDYLGKMNAVNFLFGASYENTSIESVYGGNPHSSFIRVHSFYGLFGLILVFAPLAWVAFLRVPRFHKFVFLVFVMLALLRSATEPILFPTPLDFFYFLYFFMFLKFKKALLGE